VKGPLVFLIGYRGTGKTTVARLVADRAGWDWADADAELEARAGRTIRDVFADEGEAGFRDRESAVLAELCGMRRKVVATGGGVVLRPENRERLRAGRVVWLTADVETIAARLAADPTTTSRRPHLTAAGGREEIAALLCAREPLYRACADWVVDTVGHTPDEVAGVVAGLLRETGDV